jgi:beta-lactamase class A
MVAFQRVFSIVLIWAALACGQSSSTLEQQIRDKTAGFQGKITLFAKNLSSGAVFSLSGDEPVRTASTIKVPIMIEVFAEAAEGKISLTEPIQNVPEEKVSGSGILQDLSDKDALPLKDLVVLMITLSDNTATNLILNRIGGNAVNTRMASLGLTQTRVMRKILGDRNNLKPTPSGVTDEGARPDNRKWGIGRSSPREMVMLLERLYRGELISKDASAAMIEILKKQRDHNGIARDIKDAVVANKSGALDALRSDVGIVYSPNGPVAMAITVDGMPTQNWTPDNPGELMISALSEILLNQLR